MLLDMDYRSELEKLEKLIEENQISLLENLEILYNLFLFDGIYKMKHILEDDGIGITIIRLIKQKISLLEAGIIHCSPQISSPDEKWIIFAINTVLKIKIG